MLVRFLNEFLLRVTRDISRSPFLTSNNGSRKETKMPVSSGESCRSEGSQVDIKWSTFGSENISTSPAIIRQSGQKPDASSSNSRHSCNLAKRRKTAWQDSTHRLNQQVIRCLKSLFPRPAALF